jgi:hypothetical protein
MEPRPTSLDPGQPMEGVAAISLATEQPCLAGCNARVEPGNR